MTGRICTVDTDLEARMKKNKYAKPTIAFAFSLLFVLGFAPASAVFATSGYQSSSNVLVLNENGTPYGAGGAGYFPESAASGAGYSVTYMAADDVTDVTSFGSNDTIVLWEYCTVGSDTTVQSSLTSFLQNGGKVIIWDSDSCSGSSQADYSWLSAVGASFTIETPGQTGNYGGSVTVDEDNNFLAGLNSADLGTLVSDTDAVGDLNTVTTSSQSWCATLSGTNTIGESGYASAYTGLGSLTGAPAGLIVYTGFDTDYIDYSSGGEVLVTLVLNQLAHGWGSAAYTSDLHCAQHVSPQFPPPTTPHWPCQDSGACFTAFVAFDVTSGGQQINASVTLSRSTGATLTGDTLCTWNYVGGYSEVWLTQFDVIINDANSYTVTLPNGQTATGSFMITVPWTLTIININT